MLIATGVVKTKPRGSGSREKPIFSSAQIAVPGTRRIEAYCSKLSPEKTLGSGALGALNGVSGELGRGLEHDVGGKRNRRAQRFGSGRAERGSAALRGRERAAERQSQEFATLRSRHRAVRSLAAGHGAVAARTGVSCSIK